MEVIGLYITSTNTVDIVVYFMLIARANLFITLIMGLLTLFASPSIAQRRRGGGDVYVKPYFRRDGTFVSDHMRSAPDKIFGNNWSTKGNVNPYTGKTGTKDFPSYSGGSSSDNGKTLSTSVSTTPTRLRHGLTFYDVKLLLGKPDTEQNGEFTFWTYGRTTLMFYAGKLDSWSNPRIDGSSR